MSARHYWIGAFLLLFVFLPNAALTSDYTFTTIDVSGATHNWGAYGINDSNAIAGYYADATMTRHGFLATPVPVPTIMLLLASGLIGLIGIRRKFKS